MAFVYWLHLTEHTDITTSGYIGFTSTTVEKRYKKHIIDTQGRSSRYYTLQNAIRKHGVENIIVTTLVEGSVDYCLEFEYKLRPKENIGWNIGVGGGSITLGVKRSKDSIEKQRATRLKNKTPVSKETREKLSAAHKGRPKPLSQSLRMSVYSKSLKPWQNGKATPKVWSWSLDIYEYYLKNPSYGAVRFSNYFEVTEWAIAKILRNIKAGWNPNEDEAYLSWLSEYKQKQEQVNGT